MILLALLAPAAQAFCGTYVGSAGDTLLNRQSQVVMVREGKQTTLTLSSDFVGAASFGMLVPVPADFQEADLTQVDPGPLKRVDVYDAPRLVEYTCDDLHGGGATKGCGACAGDLLKSAITGLLTDSLPSLLDAAGLAPATLQTRVITPASVADLETDLGADGLVLTDAARGALSDLIAAGSGLVRVKVDVSEPSTAPLFLPPLRLSYRSDTMSLPIRLGALNGVGAQDVVIHVITDEGEVGISNYAEVTVESECLYDDTLFTTFSGFYDDLLQTAYEADGSGAVWVEEYTWAPTSCDPCTAGGPLDEQTLRDLGYQGDIAAANITRLHLRFDPDQVDQDVMLYPRTHNPNFQQRYIAHDKSLESDFPLCKEGWAPDPGTCEDDTASADTGFWGATLPGGWWLLGLTALGLGRRRRA